MKTFTSNLVILKNTSLSIAMIESYIIHWNTGKSSGTVGTTWHRKKIDPLVGAFNFLVILLLVERLSRKQNICILFLLENLSQQDSSFMPCWHRRKGSASLFQ